MDKLLNQVEKPTRYIGGEVGAVVKNPQTVEVRIVLAFPDVYEVGMSHFGFQILYAALNELPWCQGERVYCPWPDMEALLRQNNLPLISLETRQPIREADLLGFTLQYELSVTGVLQILDLAGIALRAAERREGDPLVIGGGPCAANPEPVAPFFDALFIGEGEDGICEVAAMLRRAKQENWSRSEKITALAGIEGMYVPSLRQPVFNDGKLVGFELSPGQPERVRRRVIDDLDRAVAPRSQILANARLIHDRFTVEVMRGCARGCRFCQAGYLYRPVRERQGQGVLHLIDEGLAATGHDEVSLLSLSTGDWSPMAGVLPQLMRKMAAENVAVSLPSLRAESLTGEMAEAIRLVRRTGFTIAPEAATERLRRVINKPIDDEMVLGTVRTVFGGGWELVKLYFMVGLPTETEEDLMAIMNLIERVFRAGQSINRRARLNATISLFVPKPHTPFERFGMLTLAEAEKRLSRFPRTMFRGSISLKTHETDMGIVESAIARGDRRTADAIEAAYRNGAHFDGWSEYFSYVRWEKAFAEAGLDLAQVAAQSFADDDVLPWDGVNIGLSKEFLLAERDRALAGQITDNCRDGGCHDCGVCDDRIATRLAETFAPQPAPIRPPTPADVFFRYRLRYAKQGPARWFGHLELIKVFSRAVRRAGLPLLYSGGFHPQPRIAFGPPMAVGLASDEEYMEIVLDSRVPEAHIVERLAGALPEGLHVDEAEMIQRDATALFEQVRGWLYETDLSFIENQADFQSALSTFMRASKWPMDVEKKGRIKVVDARSLVESGEIIENKLYLRVRHETLGGLKPMVLLSVVLGIEQGELPPYAITRRRTELAE